MIGATLERRNWLLDGATGTEITRRGVDISGPVWSAEAVLDHAPLLQQIHEDYLRAGADAVTTNTFRAHARAFERVGRGDELQSVVTSSVRAAQTARDHIKPEALVLGSIGPLEDCYSPQRAPSYGECLAEHGRAIERLLNAGVDLILLETMGTAREAVAAAHAAAERAPEYWILSCLCRSDRSPGVLLNGDSLHEVIKECDSAYALGVNCVAASNALAQVQWIRERMPDSMRVVTYANTGQMDEHGAWHDTDAVDPLIYAEYARQWRTAGANIIGGCCGTTPETIRAVACTFADSP